MCRVIRQGHPDGGKKLGEFIEWCMEAGVSMATVFAFSTENWKRDEKEVSPESPRESGNCLATYICLP